MKIAIEGSVCKVTREPGDPKFRDGTWGSGESRLLYHVKKILNAQGFDLIKKRMWRDGHMVSEQQQYLRTRSSKSPCRHIFIYNGYWNIEGADKAFNKNGEVNLTVVSSVFKVAILPKPA